MPILAAALVDVTRRTALDPVRLGDRLRGRGCYDGMLGSLPFFNEGLQHLKLITVLLAVVAEQFCGTVYTANGWEELGQTAGQTIA